MFESLCVATGFLEVEAEIGVQRRRPRRIRMLSEKIFQIGEPGTLVWTGELLASLGNFIRDVRSARFRLDCQNRLLEIANLRISGTGSWFSVRRHYPAPQNEN